MRNRSKMSRKKSRRVFTKTAQNVHPKNTVTQTVMRGGIRL